MILEPIRNVLLDLRYHLKNIDKDNHIVYEAQPVLDLTNMIIELVEKSGIPNLPIKEIVATENATTRHFNMMSYGIYKTMLVITRSVDELMTKMNSLLTIYTDKINTIEPLMEDLRQRIDDIEKQTLEKVTNTSIHAHDIKMINFKKNTRTSNVSVINNTLLLPILEQKRVTVNDQAFSVIGSQVATNRLDRPIVSTIDKSDRETIIGTYFGNIVGMLDNSEDFIAEEEYNPVHIYNKDINSILRASYYSSKINDMLDIAIDSVMASPRDINFIIIDSNVDARIKYSLLGDETNIQMINNIWTQRITADRVSVGLSQRNYEPLRYQGIDVIDKASSTIVRRYNYFCSFAHLFPDIVARLNPEIEVSDIELEPNHKIQLSERTGFLKYSVELSHIGLYMNTYAVTGMWESEFIQSEGEISSVEIISKHVIPDDEIEYIRYEISFDRTTWYPLKALNEGITEFNVLKKKRIVLTNDNNNNDYLFIGEQSNSTGLFLRIKLNTNSATKTPALYNVELRIKVKENA